MNAGLQSLMPNWFRHGDHDMPDDQDIPPPIPQIAIMPMPEQTEEEKRLKVIADAHVYVAQLGQERIAKDKQIEQLQAEVGSLAHALQGERRKSGLLELDIAERDNTIATLQSDVNALREFFSVQKLINEKERLTYEKFGIEAAPKPERKPKSKKKADRKGPTETAKADT